jgi:hypothetical protein
MKMQFLLPSLAINHFQFRILTFNPMNKLSAIMLCLGLLLAGAIQKSDIEQNVTKSVPRSAN